MVLKSDKVLCRMCLTLHKTQWLFTSCWGTNQNKCFHFWLQYRHTVNFRKWRTPESEVKNLWPLTNPERSNSPESSEHSENSIHFERRMPNPLKKTTIIVYYIFPINSQVKVRYHNLIEGNLQQWKVSHMPWSIVKCQFVLYKLVLCSVKTKPALSLRILFKWLTWMYYKKIWSELISFSNETY